MVSWTRVCKHKGATMAQNKSDRAVSGPGWWDVAMMWEEAQRRTGRVLEGSFGMQQAKDGRIEWVFGIHLRPEPGKGVTASCLPLSRVWRRSECSTVTAFLYRVLLEWHERLDNQIDTAERQTAF